MRLYRVARRSGHLGLNRHGTDIPSRRYDGDMFHDVPHAFWHGKYPRQRDQRLSFEDMRADIGIEGAVFARVPAVAERIAIAERRAAPFRRLFDGGGRIFSVFRIQFGRIGSKTLAGLRNCPRRERAFAAIGPNAPPPLFRNRRLSRIGHSPDMA
jgi:hypothetical protein